MQVRAWWWIASGILVLTSCLLCYAWIYCFLQIERSFVRITTIKPAYPPFTVVWRLLDEPFFRVNALNLDLYFVTYKIYVCFPLHVLRLKSTEVSYKHALLVGVRHSQLIVVRLCLIFIDQLNIYLPYHQHDPINRYTSKAIFIIFAVCVFSCFLMGICRVIENTSSHTINFSEPQLIWLSKVSSIIKNNIPT